MSIVAMASSFPFKRIEMRGQHYAGAGECRAGGLGSAQDGKRQPARFEGLRCGNDELDERQIRVLDTGSVEFEG
ncbi:hypothetical protein [Bosea sp. NBC_00550]|uniref:hypothetical protein n=1 Tax=Bosea sp. NBC_00550 TaxID=2969621 RepID=UPI0022304AB7|nr:hypothetical protein [Bosea sp. NBC_00550]UZF91043.1 hypothetical protein NWE53_18120 [Bosea sp. NBC_00550]